MSGKTKKHYDIIVVGGGMAGMTAALIFARGGLRVACLDKVPFKQQHDQNFDTRTIAISSGSSDVLKKAGVWEALSVLGCAIDDIDVRDGDSPVLLRFESQAAGEPFGWIFENREVRRVLYEAADQEKNLTLMAPVTVLDIEPKDKTVSVSLDDGQTISTSLLVGADGRQSHVRQAYGIETRNTNYRQKALVCVVCHEKPHHGLALEHFYPEGPFALLPMPDDAKERHRSALVWTRPEHDPMRLDQVSDSLFHLALQERMDSRYGAIIETGVRRLFPLSLVHAKKYTSQRMALIADAAHGIHPIAGQGLNLGMRDIETLTRLVDSAQKEDKDIGSDDLLKRYEAERRPDNQLMIAATDALNRVFGVRFLPFRLARKGGIQLVQKIRPLKSRLMRYAMGRTI